MNITVIVCTYNRCRSLATALDSLAAQRLPGSMEWEVLVVDNNSSDQTRHVVSEYTRRYPGRFRYLFEPTQGLSAARNAGIHEARGNILAFTDDDVTAEPDWLQNLTSGLDSGEWAGAGGRILRKWTCPVPSWLSVEGRYERMSGPIVLFDLGSRSIQIDTFAMGANMAYRKLMFEKYGGFRTDLGRSGDSLLGLEDSEFGQRLLAAGERLRYEPLAVVYHPVPQNRLSKKYFLGWWYGLGRASIRTSGPGPAVLGMPRRYFRIVRNACRLLPVALGWILALKPRQRFYYKTQVWQIAGTLAECCQQPRDANPRALAARDLAMAAGTAISAPKAGERVRISCQASAEPMSGGKPRIALFGHFGRANFGNEGTLQAMLCHLRRAVPGGEFVGICTGPEAVAAEYKINAVYSRDYVVRPWALKSVLGRLGRKFIVGIPSEFYRWVQSVKLLWGVDALVVPGTGLLNDAYTLFGWGPYDMFRWSIAAKFCRCKLLFVSVGAGPLHSRRGRYFIKTALRLADFRSYRDASSQDYLSSIGFPAGRDPVYPDLAFSLPATDLPRSRDSRGRRLVVGIGLMVYAGKYSAERRPSPAYREYLDTLVEFVKWLLAYEYDIRLLIGEFVDTVVTQEFRVLLKERSVTYEEGRIVDEPVATFGDVLSQIAATDFVVATRFHNILFSILLNKPTIAISFHPKNSSLMSQMGLSDCCVDINSLKADQLIEQFGRLVNNAGRLTATMAAKVERHRAALDEQYRSILGVIWPAGERVPAAAREMHKFPN